MPQPPAYQPLFDRLLAFAIGPRFEQDLWRARAAYFQQTGEVFDEDRSFDARMQAFLEWYVFDRRLDESGATPAALFAREGAADAADERALLLLTRTVHGLFVVERVRGAELRLRDLPRDTQYAARAPARLPGVARGDLFEGRLVPFDGAWHLSPAFIFHPPHLVRRVKREVRRRRHESPDVPVQDLLWTMSRMALRAEHYRNVSVDSLYDFSRPPPALSASAVRFPRGPGRLLVPSDGRLVSRAGAPLASPDAAGLRTPAAAPARRS